MNFFEKIVNFLNAEMTRPTNYSWFHILFIFIVAIVTFLICKFFKNCSNKTFKRIVLISWIILLVFEIYKQIVYSFNFDGQNVSWVYHLHIVPLQLCSSILYMLPFVVFLKDGKIKDSFISFVASFSLFGGIAVMFYPNDVFIETIGVNIQTMVHHGLQVVMGVFFIVYYRKKLNLKFFLKGLPVFAVYVCMAMLANCVLPIITNSEINMMYISPYINNSLPIVKDIYAQVPYIIYFILMMIAYVVIGFFAYFIVLNIVKLVFKNEKKIE